MIPDIGQSAPAFSLPVIGGEYPEETTVSLEDLRGTKAVLYFYPKDDTPGGTTQACGIRDAWDELSARARVFGVSVDPIQSHRKFLAKHDLPFPLLSDAGKTMVQDYGVWGEKKMYGKTFFGTDRTTFVLDEDGKILAVFPKVKPAEHVDRHLEMLA